MHVAAVPRPRCQSEPAADLAAILEAAPERLVYQPARQDFADTLQAFQLAGLCDQRVVSFQSGTLGSLELLGLMFNPNSSRSASRRISASNATPSVWPSPVRAITSR